METKTFAFRLAVERPSGPGKAREGVALAGCTHYGHYFRQLSFPQIDNGPIR